MPTHAYPPPPPPTLPPPPKVPLAADACTALPVAAALRRSYFGMGSPPSACVEVSPPPAQPPPAPPAPPLPPSCSSVAALGLIAAQTIAEVERATGGISLDECSQERLTEIMCSPEALTKLEMRVEGEVELESQVALHLADVQPVRVTVLFPASFAALRQRFCEGGDASFVNSLWQSKPWDAGRGGKSGSQFQKTLDDRYLVKEVRSAEFWAFHGHARQYFHFVRNTPTVLPSVLVKVLGGFYVEYRSANQKSVSCKYLLVQENLFFGHNISRMYDLKGAQRNRVGEDRTDTVLDENLFRFNAGYPLLLQEGAKRQLTQALYNDTLFLNSINVMDYSLLVGIVQRETHATGEERREARGEARGEEEAREEEAREEEAGGVEESDTEWVVVGLIDYCRQYTYKEEIESRVKRATVIPPKQYKRRFREALNRYFMASIEKYQQRERGAVA